MCLDPCAAVDAYLKVPKGSDTFSQRRIILCDLRGNRGYTPSKYRSTPPTHGPHLELALSFAAFSGTSAATAIAAGLVSLAMQAKGVTDIGKVDVRKLATWGMFGIKEAMAAVE